jgi:hypothetical protein
MVTLPILILIKLVVIEITFPVPSNTATIPVLEFNSSLGYSD